MGCTSNSTADVKISEPPTTKNTQNESQKKEIILKKEEEEKNKKVEHNDKKKVFYIPRQELYTNEEISLIQKRAQEIPLTDDKTHLLYYKQIDKISKDKIFHEEISSFKTSKKEGQRFSQPFEYRSPSLKTKDVNLISFYMNDNISISYPIELRDYEIYINLMNVVVLEETESPIITFELTVEYKTPIIEMLTYIECYLNDYKENKYYSIKYCRFIKVFIETTNDFSFTYLNNDLHLNKLKKNSPHEVLLEGDTWVYKFSFILNNYKLPRENNNCFYCYNTSEIKKLEEAIYKAKIIYGNNSPNYFGIKDFYTIKNKIVNVKSYITFIYFREYFLDDYFSTSVSSYINYLNNLKVIYSKCNNRESFCKANGTTLQLDIFLKPGEQLCTIEVEYCYSIDSKEKYDFVRFEHGNCGDGFYYQLSINYDQNEYKSFSFLRKNPYLKTNSNEIKFETFYRSYKDKYNYDYLYLFK